MLKCAFSLARNAALKNASFIDIMFSFGSMSFIRGNDLVLVFYKLKNLRAKNTDLGHRTNALYINKNKGSP